MKKFQVGYAHKNLSYKTGLDVGDLVDVDRIVDIMNKTGLTVALIPSKTKNEPNSVLFDDKLFRQR